MASKMAGDDPDSCLPAPLKDFVFDLHDSARRSMLEPEQTVLYNGTFRELSSKYFAQSAWPSPESISSECGGDELFLDFYRELTHRHWHSVARIGVQDRIDGWVIYRNLFDKLLKGTTTESEENPLQNLLIIPEWAFDIFHEFVYQFQGYCQYRTQAAYASQRYSEGLRVLAAHRDAWAVETVLFYLHRLKALPSSNGSSSASAVLSRYAAVALSRLECLLGDYRASLDALKGFRRGGLGLLEPKKKEPVVAARLSAAYHAGVSCLMVRNYAEAIRWLADMCTDLQRGFRTGSLRKIHGSDQFVKLHDRMIALLAILTVHLNAGTVDESLARLIREKHRSTEFSEEVCEELFTYACPKFVSPAVPDYESSEKDETSNTNSNGTNNNTNAGQDAYRLQIRQFVREMEQQRSLHKLRSYMVLYSSISTDKLAAFNDTTEQDFLSRLVAAKHKRSSPQNADNKNQVHYYIHNNMIHITSGSNSSNTSSSDTVESARHSESFFVKGIQHNLEIMAEIDKIDINV